MNFFQRLFLSLSPSKASPAHLAFQEVSRYQALRRKYKQQGIYQDVIEDTIPYGAIPAFNYDTGTEIVTFDSEGVLNRMTVTGRRFWPVFRHVPYEEEGYFLSELRKAMPDADEFRSVSEWVDTGRKCYFAVQYPKEEISRKVE